MHPESPAWSFREVIEKTEAERSKNSQPVCSRLASEAAAQVQRESDSGAALPRRCVRVGDAWLQRDSQRLGSARPPKQRSPVSVRETVAAPQAA